MSVGARVPAINIVRDYGSVEAIAETIGNLRAQIYWSPFLVLLT
jgi:hypothetical protein